MITVTHYPSDWDTMPDVSWSVRDDAAIAANHPAYYTGYDKPNYPMPAIRRRVVMHVDNNGMCHAVSVGNRFYPRQNLSNARHN